MSNIQDNSIMNYMFTCLERHSFNANQWIPEEHLVDWGEKPTIEAWSDAIHQLWYVLVTKHVWGEKLETIDIEYPADWWHALKERWFPLWAKKRWPVKKTKVYREVWAMLPRHIEKNKNKLQSWVFYKEDKDGNLS